MELQVHNNFCMCRHTEITVCTSVCMMQLCVQVLSCFASVELISLGAGFERGTSIKQCVGVL